MLQLPDLMLVLAELAVGQRLTRQQLLEVLPKLAVRHRVVDLLRCLRRGVDTA